MTTASRTIPAEAVIFLCRNCFPGLRLLPDQWSDGATRVRVKEIPCSGKIDAQYILHALEGGVLGVCVVACPKGKCTLAQGNYRAEIRVKTVRRLLEEIGTDPLRAQLIQCSEGENPEALRRRVDQTIRTFSSLAAAASVSA